MQQMPQGFPPGLIPGQQQVPPERVYVNFAAEVNPVTAQALLGVMAKLINDRIPKVTLMLSTPGGVVMSGLTIYNFLRSVPFELTTHNIGNVDSIGNAIYLSGVHRHACEHSTFMFHGVGFQAQPGQRFDEKSVREAQQGLLADQQRIGSIVAERTKLDQTAVGELFLEARTKSATDAASVGIVHEIRDVDLPAGGPIISLVFGS
jgi:ATP-dependent protease ClpP protease subunit